MKFGLPEEIRNRLETTLTLLMMTELSILPEEE